MAGTDTAQFRRPMGMARHCGLYPAIRRCACGLRKFHAGGRCRGLRRLLGVDVLVFAGLAAGRYSYRLALPGGVELGSAAPLQLTEGEEERVLLRAALSPLTIAGRVVEPDGSPVPSIVIFILRIL